MDVVCFCEEYDRKCKEDKECKEYVVKFTEIKRKIEPIGNTFVNINLKDVVKNEKLLKKATKDLTKQATELKKSIKKFKIR